MRDVAIVSSAQVPNVRKSFERDDVEMVQEVVERALAEVELPRDRVGFFCMGSNDFLTGRPFSFVTALDGIGAWPPIAESHVEMDGAWALYEAYLRLQHGDIDAAIAYSFGRSSAGEVRDILALQLDPYLVTPLWPDSISVAALQARAVLDSGTYTERDFAEVAARNRARGKDNPYAQVTGDFDVDAILAETPIVDPLRKHDCPPISDGAAAVLLCTEELARELVDSPAWIRGIDHRIEAASLGVRDLTRSTSTAIAAEKTGVANGPIDVAELHAPFSFQELILRDALGIGDDTDVNPSGGALCANPIMVAGLSRIAEAAAPILAGTAKRALAHATSGPALQHNLVCVLEA